MIEDIINVIKKSRKRRKEIYEYNKKRYWKFTPSERSHYDSVRDRINRDNKIYYFLITFSVMRVFLYLLGFFLLLKLLFELDKSIFIVPTLSIIRILPLIFGVAFTFDILSIFVNELFTKPRNIKKLNKNYGFKSIHRK